MHSARADCIDGSTRRQLRIVYTAIMGNGRQPSKLLTIRLNETQRAAFERLALLRSPRRRLPLSRMLRALVREDIERRTQRDDE